MAAERIAGGAWLRAARKEARLTTAELAEKIGVHQSQVSNYEMGKSAISDRRARALADALNLDLATVRRGLGLWSGDAPEAAGPEPATTTPGPVTVAVTVCAADWPTAARALARLAPLAGEIDTWPKVSRASVDIRQAGPDDRP